MTIGWRYWRIDGNTLVSPYAHEPLTGPVLASHCPTGHPDASPLCSCGVSFYPWRSDLQKVVSILHPDAVTLGTITGPAYPETPRVYNVDGNTIALPTGARCSGYAITTIYTDTRADLTHYGVPIHPLEALDAEALPNVW
jgi:hypothetical protein